MLNRQFNSSLRYKEVSNQNHNAVNPLKLPPINGRTHSALGRLIYNFIT